jgi:hypothetical protein
MQDGIGLCVLERCHTLLHRERGAITRPGVGKFHSAVLGVARFDVPKRSPHNISELSVNMQQHISLIYYIMNVITHHISKTWCCLKVPTHSPVSDAFLHSFYKENCSHTIYRKIYVHYYTVKLIESKGFWRWCKHSVLLGIWTLSIVRYCRKLENTIFWKLDLFPSSGEWADTYSVGSLRKS